MKKNYTKHFLTLLAIILSSSFYAQTNRVLVTVDWPAEAYEHKVEVYDPANNLLVSICNNNITAVVDDNCYTTSGTDGVFTATYDLGCLELDPIPLPNYYVKLFDAGNDGWSSGSVTVNVGGTDVLTNDGNGADIAGESIIFNVASAILCTFPDSDMDGVIDFVDQDDDNDGILDTEEGLALNQFNCEVPSLIFENGVYEGGGSGAETLGAIYRFSNASEGIDVLLEIVELDNTTILNIDNDGVDTAEFLQSELEFTGNGVPGVTYEFSLVDAGTSILAGITRIGGTTWDCDGVDDYQESVRYYYPSAYGLDNPTSLTTDVYSEALFPGEAGAGITAGNITYAGFSTNTILRSYFQFLANKFKIRMQLKKTTSNTRARLYAMSFTQCDIFDYKAPTLTILTGQDTDFDGLNNQMDLDSDNDGIPDNVEAQSTLGYITPNSVFDLVTGIDTAYAGGIIIVDTDGDNVPDFIDLDSDSDGTPDIQENGMADAIVTFTDSDNDGLDNLFEGGTDPTTELDPLDVNDDINNPSASILPDTDGDLGTLGGDLDYRDASDFGAATIDFDGVNDYVDSDQILGGYTNASIMAWVKLNTAFNADGFVVGQDNFNLYIKYGALNTNTLVAVVNGVSAEVTTTNLSVDKWVHVAAVYANGDLKIYVNGEEELNTSLSVALNTSTDNFTIGKNPNDSQLFKGAIDEVRVFDVRLTENQLQQMVFQEIEQNGLNVQGTIVPLDISNFAPSSEVPWANLQAYYPMTNVVNTKTLDYSDYNRNAILHNIETIQPQTAPMPYETKSGGSDELWTNTENWLHGDVWDIEEIPNKDWSIVQLHDNITTSSSHKHLGLFIDSGVKFTVSGDNEINNGWYLQLDGILDLEDDSQLVQGVNSDLVTSSDGKILRRQEGNLNYYWYNYWSSPVGAPATTTNTNTNFSINMLKDGPGITDFVEFTSAYDEEGKVSNRWLYKYQNGRTYNDWEALTQSSLIEPGVGYTQKGTSNADGEQNYIFEGKPNNGIITLSANDVVGDSADEHLNGPDFYNYTSYLIGNPYPSAIDARLFIEDNGPDDPLVLDDSGLISGTVYVWEQWAGSSHNLDAYEGGYGTINYTTAEQAYQWNDPASGPNTLAKTPTFYIPVGQGFFVEVVADSGDIEFNNSQRVFIKESDADSDPTNNSVFFRTSNQDDNQQPDIMSLIRLELNVSNGNMRRFALGFSESATDGYDYGYDARTIDPQLDDMNSYLDDEKMIIQTFAPITSDKVVDLVFNSTGSYNYTIEMVGIKNIPEDQEIYLRDNLTNTYFDLRSGAYSFSSEVNAEDTERFDIVFKPGETLSNDDFDTNNTLIYVNNPEDKLYVKGLTAQAKQLSLTNILGQTMKIYHNLSSHTLENGLDISNLSSGVYLVNLETENGTQLSKKIILE